MSISARKIDLCRQINSACLSCPRQVVLAYITARRFVSSPPTFTRIFSMSTTSAAASAPRPPAPAKPSNIESVLKEKRVFKPSAKFAKAARIGSLKKYQKMHQASLKNPDKFWGKAAGGADLVHARGKKSASGSRPSRSGSSAANSTPASTASTAISTGRCATRRPSSSRASRATSSPSPTSSSTAKSASWPTC